MCAGTITAGAGVLWRRTKHSSWSRFYGTEDPAEVERKCAEEGTAFERTPEGRLADLAPGIDNMLIDNMLNEA